MLKYLFITFFTFTLSVSSQSPQNQFNSDLDFVYNNLKQTTSYKTQKNKHATLDSIYLNLKHTPVKSDFSLLESLVQLYSLVDVLQDYHNEIVIDYSSFVLPDSNSVYSTAFPVSKMNLDSLTSVLVNSEMQQYQGIYSYKNLLQVAIVENDNRLKGIVLESKLPQWTRSQIMFYLIPKKEDRFALVTGTFKNKNIISVIDYFKDGTFLAFGWTKQKPENFTNHYNVPQKDKLFILEDIATNVTYIKIGTLSNTPSIKQEIHMFLKQMKKKDLKQVLLVDLRNNTGGNIKNAKGLLKLLKNYKGRLYVLINFRTVSAGERLALLLKQRTDATLVGDRTNGTLTYGHNYNANLQSPSTLFKVHFTDLKDNWRALLPYEGSGVAPDIYLDYNKDWIKQTLEL